MFVQAYLNTAQQILNEYQGEEPFHSFLTKYFGANKKFGSRDRKHIAHLCYCFFRLGSSLKEVSTAERMLIGLFLCNNSKSLLLEKLNSGLNDEVEKELIAAGSSMQKVLKVSVLLHDLNDYKAMNESYKGRFGDKPPVRTTVAVYGGVPGASLVEIDCIAYI